MDRRRFTQTVMGLAFLPSLLGAPRVMAQAKGKMERMGKVIKSEEEWRSLLTPEQFHVLREEGTERAFTSPLLEEKRAGEYVCVACGLALFDASMKYDSGTGWPSFFTVIEGRVETRLGFRLIYPRTEYHCARCGGHQGHVFKDGPPPTGKRYCNNGVALRFIPASS